MMSPVSPDVVMFQAIDVPSRMVLHFRNLPTLFTGKSAIGADIPLGLLYAVLFLFEYLDFKVHKFAAANSLFDAPVLLEHSFFDNSGTGVVRDKNTKSDGHYG
jgi:hypothetical protein